MKIEYKLILSDRKTIGLEIRGGSLLVRAPRGAKQADIDRAVEAHRGWIETHLREAEARKRENGDAPKLSPEDIRALAEKAAKTIPERVAWYAPKVGVTYGRITIRNQRSRWGSCSAKGNLNFNCLLMLAPPEVLDSVVVHELCHRKEMNHSPRFYAEVYRVFPEYDKYHSWLKQNGARLLAMME